MSVELTKDDLAKYPFCREAKVYVSKVGLELTDIMNPDYGVIFDRAYNRIKSAIELGYISTNLSDVDVEILSYPAALLILGIIGEAPLYKRYAVSEAKRIYEALRVDDDLKVKYLAESNFGWKIKFLDLGLFNIFFTDFLQVAPFFNASSCP